MPRSTRYLAILVEEPLTPVAGAPSYAHFRGVTEKGSSRGIQCTTVKPDGVEDKRWKGGPVLNQLCGFPPHTSLSLDEIRPQYFVGADN